MRHGEHRQAPWLRVVVCFLPTAVALVFVVFMSSRVLEAVSFRSKSLLRDEANGPGTIGEAQYVEFWGEENGSAAGTIVRRGRSNVGQARQQGPSAGDPFKFLQVVWDP